MKTLQPLRTYNMLRISQVTQRENDAELVRLQKKQPELGFRRRSMGIFALISLQAKAREVPGFIVVADLNQVVQVTGA